MLVKSLTLASGVVSERVADWFARSYAYSLVVAADGFVLAKCGGNSSGGYLTGVINSCNNDLMHFDCWAEYFDCPVDEVLGHVDWVMCGDDDLETPPSVGALQSVIDLMQNRFGARVKLDVMSGELYPAQCHAPFLSRVSTRIGDLVFRIPSEPCRMLSSWQVPVGEEVEQVDGMYTGLMQELVAYRFVRETGVIFPIPTPVFSFLEDYDRYRSERSLDGGLPGHQTLEEALEIAFSQYLE